MTATALFFPFIILLSSLAICCMFFNRSSGIQDRKTVLVFQLRNDCTSVVFLFMFTKYAEKPGLCFLSSSENKAS